MIRLIAILLLCLGFLLAGPAWRAGGLPAITWSASFVAIVIVLRAIGALEPLSRLFGHIDKLKPTGDRRLTLGIFFTSAICFPAISTYYGRSMHPAMHDEQMHAIQLQLLAIGKLWLPAHPMADFFETFHVYVKPLYAPFHFPGTAILNVASVWLHLPVWLIPVLMMSAACALGFHIASHLFSRSMALLVPISFLSIDAVQTLAPMVISHNAMLFLGLLWIAAFLKWQKDCQIKWAIALGAIGGLAAITRPVDAIAFGIAILTGIGFVLYKKRNVRLTTFTWITGVLVATPFLLLQLVFDKNVTGSWLTTPYKHYSDINYPQTIYAGTDSGSPTAIPRVSALLQKQIYYESFMLRRAQLSQQKSFMDKLFKIRIPGTLTATLANPLVLLFVPIGLLGINSVARWVAITPAMFFLIAYTPHGFYAPHYAAIIAVPIIILVLCGIEQFAVRFTPRSVYKTQLIALVVAITAALFMFGTQIKNRQNPFKIFYAVNFVQERLPALVSQPALVFCKFDPDNSNYNDEPVYNFHSANIDDSAIVFAQSLGKRNQELVDYYQHIGQNRSVYLLDRGTMTLTPAGTVNNLAASPATRPAVGLQP